MGLFDAVFGRDDEAVSTARGEDDEDERYAIILNAGPDTLATGGNALGYAVELDDAGYDVQLFLDGAATQWPTEFAENPNRPFNHLWSEVRSRGILAGACGYCANAFDAVEACELADVALLSDAGEHAPSVAQLAGEGYELVTVG